MKHCWLRFRFHKWNIIRLIAKNLVIVQKCSECGKILHLE